MRPLVESLRRLYRAGKVTEEKITELYNNNKITEEEYNYILEV